MLTVNIGCDHTIADSHGGANAGHPMLFDKADFGSVGERILGEQGQGLGAPTLTSIRTKEKEV